MTNFEWIKSLTSPVDMCGFITRCIDSALYANGRLIDKDKPSDLLEWLEDKAYVGPNTIYESTLVCGRCGSAGCDETEVLNERYLICRNCHTTTLLREDNYALSKIEFSKRKYNST